MVTNEQGRSQTRALGAILRVSLHPLALCFAPSVIPLVQMVQSEAPEGAMTPAEGTIAPTAPVWLRAC